MTNKVLPKPPKPVLPKPPKPGEILRIDLDLLPEFLQAYGLEIMKVEKARLILYVRERQNNGPVDKSGN